MRRIQLVIMFMAGSVISGSGWATVAPVTSATSLVGAAFEVIVETAIAIGRGGAQIFDGTVSVMAGDWAPGDPPPVSVAPPAAWPALPAAPAAPLVPAPPLRK